MGSVQSASMSTSLRAAERAARIAIGLPSQDSQESGQCRVIPPSLVGPAPALSPLDLALRCLPIQVRYTDPCVPTASLTFLKCTPGHTGHPPEADGYVTAHVTAHVPGNEADRLATPCTVRYVHRSIGGEVTDRVPGLQCSVTQIRGGMTAGMLDLTSALVAVPSSAEARFLVPMQLSFKRYMKVSGSFQLELVDRTGMTRACSQAFVILSKPPKASFRTPQGERLYLANIVRRDEPSSQEVVELRSGSGTKPKTGPFRHLPYSGDDFKCTAIPRENCQGVVVTGDTTPPGPAAAQSWRSRSARDDKLDALQARVDKLERLVRELRRHLVPRSPVLACLQTPASRVATPLGKRLRRDWMAGGLPEERN